MAGTTANPNKDFYTEHMVDSTVRREGVWPEEAAILKKYLTDAAKTVVEAGAGGGRLTFFIEELGFDQVTGFDIVSEMMAIAQKKATERNSKVHFLTGDASNLDCFPDANFDYLVYIQQVLCFVPQPLFHKALMETFRIAKKDATIIFSFLDYHSRFYNPILSFLSNTLRYLRKETVSKHHLPWLKLNDTEFNWKLFAKGQPSIYWPTKDSIIEQLKAVGFRIEEVVKGNEIHKKGNKGALYIVCKK
ncbi:class I SAM-dependent methyltransferase [Maribacter sp. 2-571]|uniref:class I SAM-dependent methyltransferase n=1 Tax=Maribacter sp. 2-571 TaxID=3417569 RepID=UPI003D351BB2